MIVSTLNCKCPFLLLAAQSSDVTDVSLVDSTPLGIYIYVNLEIELECKTIEHEQVCALHTLALQALNTNDSPGFITIIARLQLGKTLHYAKSSVFFVCYVKFEVNIC